jgi:hypothetical protein
MCHSFTDLLSLAYYSYFDLQLLTKLVVLGEWHAPSSAEALHLSVSLLLLAIWLASPTRRRLTKNPFWQKS